MLENCQSAKDWGEACDKIKGARGQAYPDDWWDRIRLSGVMDRILARWGAGSDLTVAPFKFNADGKSRGK